MTSENKIRLLYVVGTLGTGGAEVQIARTLPYFDKGRFDIQLAHYTRIDQQQRPGKMLEEAGVKVSFLDREGWGRLRYFARATRFMRQQKFDIVHAWTGTTNFYGRLPAIMAKVPVIIGGLLGRRTANGIGNRIIYSLTNFRGSGWIVNAAEIKEIAEKKLFFLKHTPIYVVPNGIETGDESIFKREQHTFYDDLKESRPVIGTVGRLTPVKNHLLFIEMADKLTQSGVDADYWIIGDGPLASELKERIRRCGLDSRVRLLGYRSDVDIGLARMEVFVLTSDSEGCPNVVLEAMRAGLPVVSTNCGSLEEMIEDGNNGYTVPVGDSSLLAERVKGLVLDAEARKKMGSCSREIVSQRFNMPLAVKRLEGVYIEALKRAGVNNPEYAERLKRAGIL